MIKFIAFWILGYFLFKIAKTFIEPMFNTNTNTKRNVPTQAPKPAVKGDYIEYTEIK